MTVTSVWSVFTDASSLEAATVVVNRVLATIDAESVTPEVSPYHKGGQKAVFRIDHQGEWASIVLEVLGQTQLVARSLTVHGSVADSLDLWSTESSVSGVTAVGVAAVADGAP